MAKAKKCVICQERDVHIVHGDWCPRCISSRAVSASGIYPEDWAARRARYYERKRWTKKMQKNYAWFRGEVDKDLAKTIATQQKKTKK